MSKRGATRELNHDNWNEEEEKEEKGVFKRATDDEIKGRKICKAKRRNLTQDQRENVFSGFSFSSASANKTDNAFGFLKPKSTFETESKPSFGFVFGGKPPEVNTAEKPFGGFVFGVSKVEDKKSEEKEAAKEDVKDSVNGDLNGEKNGVAEEEDKKIEEEMKNGVADIKNGISEEKKEVDTGFAKFMCKSDKWNCDMCMVSNPSDKTKCLCCEAPKPGSSVAAPAPVPASFNPIPKTDEKPKDDFFSKFKEANKGKWSCDICMINNNADSNKCVACETPKPGTEAQQKEEPQAQMSFGSGGGFKFSSNDSSTTSGGFSFGGTALANVKPADGGGGFMFGSSAPSSVSQPGGGFKFGGSDASTNSEKPASQTNGGFTFGASTTSSSGGGFKFGSTESSTSPNSAPTKEDKNDSDSKEGGFKFGASAFSSPSAPLGGGFKFGSTDSFASPKSPLEEVKKDSDSKVGGFKFGGSSPSTPLGFKFGPQTRESGGIFGEPKGPFGTPAGEKSSTTVATPSNTDSGSRKKEYLKNVKDLNTQVTSWINKHISSNSLVDLTPVFDDYKKHMTNIRTKYGIQAYKAKVEDTKTASAEDSSKHDEDMEESAKEEITEHKEENSFYSTKCKLFLKKDGKYEDRGKGSIYLKKHEDDADKVQLIIRSENVLATILLNVLVNLSNPGIEKAGPNNVVLVTVPNPAIPDLDDGPATFLVRVKGEETRDELFQHLKPDDK